MANTRPLMHHFLRYSPTRRHLTKLCSTARLLATRLRRAALASTSRSHSLCGFGLSSGGPSRRVGHTTATTRTDDVVVFRCRGRCGLR